MTSITSKYLTIMITITIFLSLGVIVFTLIRPPTLHRRDIEIKIIEVPLSQSQDNYNHHYYNNGYDNGSTIEIVESIPLSDKEGFQDQEDKNLISSNNKEKGIKNDKKENNDTIVNYSF